jgi:integrase
MGRKRKDDPHGLAGTRLYWRHGQFYYVHRDGRWEGCGADVGIAKARAALHNDGAGEYGTVRYWLGQFLVHCEARVKAGTFAQRTLDDYTGYVERGGPLDVFFGAMLPEQITPHHVSKYLEENANLIPPRPVPANRERACLSSMLSWLMRQDGKTTLQVNPCMRASGVRRNPEKKREVYVEDAWYHATFAEAGESLRVAMELVYRTLQRPEVDVLAWTPANIKAKASGRVLHFRQSKTGRLLDIALVGRLDDLVRRAIGEVPHLHQPIVHTTRATKKVPAGSAYTYDGLCSNLKKAQARARAAAKKAGKPLAMPSWGLRDLKGKGATDLWLAGEPIERIQLLCGHADKATTERYIKARWRETAQPNNAEIGR